MKVFLICSLLAVLNGCDQSKPESKNILRDKEANVHIGIKQLLHEVAGSSYLKKATQYFVVYENDTSNFQPVFSEFRENGKVSLSLNLSYTQRNITHKKKLEELKNVLNEAIKDYNFDSLRSISIGRLIQTGDLAISVTKKYEEKISDLGPIKVSDYEKISEFLLRSPLAEDFNQLLEPYDLVVSKIGVEKVFFAKNNELFKYSQLETDSINVPSQILDAITWLHVKRP